MISYKILAETSGQTLHQTFIEAFSDYQVKMDLPYWKFQQMLVRRGYDSGISVGAFKDKTLVAFALTGVRCWNGKVTAYDIATGVVPEYRRHGITSAMFVHIKNLLKEKQVEQYLLEVIKSNQPAVQLYQKQGFEVQRDFSCFQLRKDRFIPCQAWKVEKVNRIDFEQVKGFWDWEPSWQNSIASVEAVSETFSYFVVKSDDAIMGYGIIDEKTGDIPQLAINRDNRGRGIARSIMTAMVKSTEMEKISMVNVENRSERLKNFLIQCGFEYHVDQFEMLLKL